VKFYPLFRRGVDVRFLDINGRSGEPGFLPLVAVQR